MPNHRLNKTVFVITLFWRTTVSKTFFFFFFFFFFLFHLLLMPQTKRGKFKGNAIRTTSKKQEEGEQN